jgi:hypothetical protein
MEIGLDVDGSVGRRVRDDITMQEPVDGQASFFPAASEDGRGQEDAGQEVLRADLVLPTEDSGRHAGFGEDPAQVVVVVRFVFLEEPGEVALEVGRSNAGFEDFGATAAVLPDGPEDIARLDFTIGDDGPAESLKDAAGSLGEF